LKVFGPNNLKVAALNSRNALWLGLNNLDTFISVMLYLHVGGFALVFCLAALVSCGLVIKFSSPSHGEGRAKCQAKSKISRNA